MTTLKFSRKVILNSQNGYSPQYDSLLEDLIDNKVLLFCVVGKDCELWHDVMDEMIVGNGSIERDFEMLTTWHEGESIKEVEEFARDFDIEGFNDEPVQIISI